MRFNGSNGGQAGAWVWGLFLISGPPAYPPYIVIIDADFDLMVGKRAVGFGDYF
jgi:hypothetical protein